MTKQERYQFIIGYFLQHAPDAETELLYDNPFQLLVAVILLPNAPIKELTLPRHLFLKNTPMQKQ